MHVEEFIHSLKAKETTLILGKVLGIPLRDYRLSSNRKKKIMDEYKSDPEKLLRILKSYTGRQRELGEVQTGHALSAIEREYHKLKKMTGKGMNRKTTPNFDKFIHEAIHLSALYNAFIGILISNQDENSKFENKVSVLSQAYFDIWQSALDYLGATEEQKDSVLEGHSIDINEMTIKGVDLEDEDSSDILNAVDATEIRDDVFVPTDNRGKRIPLGKWNTQARKFLTEFKKRFKPEMKLIK